MSTASAAFFCPQTKRADESYLNGLYNFLRRNIYGQILLAEVASLADDYLWELFASANDRVRNLSHGPTALATLRAWASDGISGPLSRTQSNITSLPLLAVLQIGQYLRYLEVSGITHAEFIAHIREAGGGVHGYCGGLPAAICLACAETEDQMTQFMGAALKILVGIGAYTEAADESSGTENTLLAVRLKHEGQAEELTSRFPGTYISAITAPRSVSIGGPATVLREFARHVTENEGIRVQEIHLGGSAHNPANSSLAAELCRLCHDTTHQLQLPEVSQLLVPLRTNRDGRRLVEGSLTDDLIWTMLAARCEWFELLKGVAQDLTASGQTEHSILIFGWDDCVTMSPFYQARLAINKIFAKTLIEEHTWHHEVQSLLPQPSPEYTSEYSFPEDAIAITGVACRLPGANNIDELWNVLANGRNCAQELPGDRFDKFKSFRAANMGGSMRDRTFYGNFIDDVKRFDHAFFGISAREAAQMDPQQRIMLELSFEALEDAGYLASHRRVEGDNVGCFLGLVLGEYVENTNAHPPTAYTSTGTVPAFVCGRLSHVYGWSGPSEMFNTACSSSMVAINRACKAIQTGECRMAIAGGANVMTGINTYLDLAKAGFLSPTGQCKPFRAAGDGYCRADGCGLVVLKKLKDAITDRDHIWGVICGVATNQGGLSASLTIPDGSAQKALYRNVLSQAGLHGEQVTYIEAHGTGTQVGDPIEMDSIRTVFGGDARDETAFVGSIKGNIGHAEPAAGIAGLLKVLAMIRHGKIPPQPGFDVLNPKIAPLDADRIEVSRILRSWDASLRAALVNSYGAAGSNGALICCARSSPGFATKQRAFEIDTLFPLVVTAASKESLVNTSRALGKYVGQQSSIVDIRLGDVAYTLNQRRQRQKYVARIKARTVQEAAHLLGTISVSGLSQPEPPVAIDAARPLVLAFSGQTSQTIALPQCFYDEIPAFRFYLEECDAEFRKFGSFPLIPVIHQTSQIEDIAALHCGIFAVQYACALCWIDAGAKPSAVLGHSLGELTALVVSGTLSLADGIRLIATRARLIERQWGPDPGAMSAIECTSKDFEEISRLVPKLEVACFNGPKSLVLSGPTMVVEKAEEVIRAHPIFQHVRTKRLSTSHGYHSSLVDSVLADLEVTCKSLKWNKPSIPLYACTADGSSTDPVKHARQPVYFVQAVQRVEEDLGPCVWLEAGLDSTIMTMTRMACSRPAIHRFQPLRTKSLHHPSDIITDAIVELGSANVHLSHWTFLSPSQDTPQTYQTVWLPPYQFADTRHWLENVDRAFEMRALWQAQIDKTMLPELSAPALPDFLVSKRSSKDHTGYDEFCINTQNARYRSVVEGHVVSSHPLCPAPMHMECATSALLLLIGNDQALMNKSITFENFNIRSPLGLDPPGDVLLRLEEIHGAQQTWRVTIVSVLNKDNVVRRGHTPLETVHLETIMSLSATTALNSFHRLVWGAMKRLEGSQSSERWQSKRAYKLFSRVVKYADFFKGISSIRLEHHEAVAVVKTPSIQPHRELSKSWTACDAVVLDMCIHVVGLLINSSDAIMDEEVAVMVGLDRAIISPGFRMDSSTEWIVYSTCEFTEDQHLAHGDVFIWSHSGELVAMFGGCRMSRLPFATLEKALRSTFSSAKSSQPGGTQQSQAPRTTNRGIETADAGLADVQMQQETKNTSALEATLLDLIADSTMCEKSQIPYDQPFALIGLDSLASTELSEDLASKLGLRIDTTVLLQSTLLGLQKMLGTAELETSSSKPYYAHFQDQHLQAQSREQEDDSKVETFYRILAEASGADAVDIAPDAMLADLGIDSLGLLDIKQELEQHFSETIDLDMSVTVKDVLRSLNFDHDTQVDHQETPGMSTSASTQSDTSWSVFRDDPFDILSSLSFDFDKAARKHDVLGYWSHVAPLQNDITVAYIVEALSALGVDLAKLDPGDSVPHFAYLSPKYDKLVRRCWEILQKRGIVDIPQRAPVVQAGQPSEVIRGSTAIDTRLASQLLQEFDLRYPSYIHEKNLIELTGPRLADCLSGQVDSVQLMFGSPQSLKIMENYYGCSPLTAALTEQLIVFLTSLLRSSIELLPSKPVRILEVGGGTGGTTRHLLKALAGAGIATQYTFTDISPTLVKKAKAKFQGDFPWITYTTLNLELEVQSDFIGQFDVVIATNVVHATTDRTATCRRIRQMLTPAGGLFILAETTSKIDWCDICFGLLDGWWFADGPIAPLQTANEWTKTFGEAQYASVKYSQGSTADVNTSQLIVGSNVLWGMKPDAGPFSSTTSTSTRSTMEDSEYTAEIRERMDGYRRETFVYKEIDGVQINADVYFPKVPSSKPMPIALMVHGGGYVTLSRRAVRPNQTSYLLRNGVLPVSIDYRLCPEVNIIDGPMTDVCDAYRWSLEKLPSIAATSGVQVDSGHVVAIGWSTGGQLAMSLAWTAEVAGLPLPSAVLSFYAPVDFESGELDAQTFGGDLPQPQMPLNRIIESLPSKPVTSSFLDGDTSDMGWVRPGDPRSELLITMSQEGIALPILLNGLQYDESPQRKASLNLEWPTSSQIASISPLARLRSGQYNVPTFIIHGTNDEVAPFSGARRFVDEMISVGGGRIRHGFLALDGASHLFDLRLGERSEAWDNMIAPGYRFLFELMDIQES